MVINEVMSSNGFDIEDEDGDNPDWIELYNKGEEAYNLKGHYLTDDPVELEWEFPEYVLGPGEFLIVFASNKDRTSGELHTNFAISKEGEPLYLVDPGHSILDKMEPVFIPRDKSFGRKPDGSDNWLYFKNPTPGKSNTTEGYNEKLQEPKFSHQGGFHADPFELKITHPDPDAEIRYTLDGSPPTRSSDLYEGPLEMTSLEDKPNRLSEIQTAYEDYWKEPLTQVNKINVVRAKAFKPNTLPSDKASQSYLVEEEEEERYSFPVASIQIDEKDLFDYDTGMYIPGRRFDENYTPGGDVTFLPANYTQRGRAWERPVHFELYDRNGKQALSQKAGVRIHGGGSRAYQIKSLRLYARRDYGKFYFNYPLFDDKQELQRSKRIILRTSGDDRNQALFRDAFIQSLYEGLEFQRQGTKPVIVFINGEYWGIHNIRERIDRFYLEENEGVDADEVDLLSGNRAVPSEGSNEHYENMLDFIEGNSLERDEHFEQVKEKMDIENFRDYYIGQLYCSNYDWPGNNIDFWRPQQPDGQWQWIMFDTDLAFGYSGRDGYKYDMIDHATEEDAEGWPNPPESTFLFRNVLKNESFRHDFINRYADLLNSKFLPDRVIGRLEGFKERYKPEIEEHINRWNNIDGMQQWEEYIEIMRLFANKRPEVVRGDIIDHFEAEEAHKVNLTTDNPKLGYIRINTIDIHELEGGWDGLYFEGIPIELEAVPYEGATFRGWEGDKHSSEPTLKLDPEEPTALKALFSPEEDFEFPYTNPRPHDLSREDFTLDQWDSNEEAGTYPEHTVFHQTFTMNPGEKTQMSGDWTLPYDLDQTSRIVGLGRDGIGFRNTGAVKDTIGAGFVGSAVVALDATNRKNLKVSWTGETLDAADQHYALRLQYRTSPFEPFRDVKKSNRRAVQYFRDPLEGKEKRFEDIELPDKLDRTNYFQLQWRYHHVTGESGKGPLMRLDDIKVSSRPIFHSEEDEAILYPNPNSGDFSIDFQDPLKEPSTLSIFNVQGGKVKDMDLKEDRKRVKIDDMVDLKEGVYLLRIYNNQQNFTLRMLLK